MNSNLQSIDLSYYQDIFDELSIPDYVHNILEVHTVKDYDILEVCLTKDNLYLVMPSVPIILLHTKNSFPKFSLLDAVRVRDVQTTLSLITHILEDIIEACNQKLYVLCAEVHNIQKRITQYLYKIEQIFPFLSSTYLPTDVFFDMGISHALLMQDILKLEYKNANYFSNSSKKKKKAIANNQDFVYLIKAGDSNLVKIGYSHNPARRLKDMQTGSAITLELLGIKSGGKQLEALLHNKYAHLRVQGEWFMMSDDLLSEFDL